MIPRLIDELPVLAVAMTAARGTSIVKCCRTARQATDRIAVICSEFGPHGGSYEATADGFIVQGQKSPLHGAAVDSHGDHRIAMSLAIAALLADGPTVINNSEAVNVSFPDFWDTLERLRLGPLIRIGYPDTA
jgi:3-phosphoshikimate 1-carboxyvinyltransferase